MKINFSDFREYFMFGFIYAVLSYIVGFFFNFGFFTLSINILTAGLMFSIAGGLFFWIGYEVFKFLKIRIKDDNKFSYLIRLFTISVLGNAVYFIILALFSQFVSIALINILSIFVMSSIRGFIFITIASILYKILDNELPE